MLRYYAATTVITDSSNLLTALQLLSRGLDLWLLVFTARWRGMTEQLVELSTHSAYSPFTELSQHCIAIDFVIITN